MQTDDMSPFMRPFVTERLAGHSSHYLTCLKTDMEPSETDCGEHGTRHDCHYGNLLSGSADTGGPGAITGVKIHLISSA